MEFNPNHKTEIEKIKCKNGSPTIYGEFTDWKPQKMREIREYCEKINSDKPDIFELCKERFLIPDKYDKIEELPEKEKETYAREVTAYYDSYKKIWKHII